MTPKIAAYITLYKDQEAAMKCIQAIKYQSYPVDTIFIVDNSEQQLLANDHDELLKIHHCPDNIGIGQGLVLALAWAEDLGYDFLWTFDQDSIPTDSCLETLVSTHNRLLSDVYKIGIIAPTAIDPRTGMIIEGAMFIGDRFIGHKHHHYHDFYECDSPITSGSLISLAAAKTIAPPRADLFIDGIDWDYGLRLKMEGFHNLIVPGAIMHHNFGIPIQVKLKHKKIIFQQYSDLRNYYICRNHTYLETRYSQGWNRLKSYQLRLKYLIRTILLIWLYDSDNKNTKIWACILGTLHGLQGKLGKM
ncbi:MAG: glycosyltransferase [Calothrix sp. MO_167.B12]|nr:glycosyltransferase [Calothrix sp. MO_167.B12]